MDSSLLEPSLSTRRFRAIYSRTAVFAAAFLLGGFAAAIMAWANSRRLGRLKRDVFWLLLSFTGTAIVLTVALSYYPNSTNAGVLNDGAGFVTWLVFNYLHGDAHRSMEAFGTPHPRPYKMVLLACLGSAILIFCVAAIFMELTGLTP